MSIKVLNTIETLDLPANQNDRFRSLFKNGIYSGGLVSKVANTLEVTVGPFFLISEGMVVRDDDAVNVQKLKVAANMTQAVGLRVIPSATSKPIVEWMVVVAASMGTIPDNDKIIWFGLVTTNTVEATTIVPYSLHRMDALGRTYLRPSVATAANLPAEGQALEGDICLVLDVNSFYRYHNQAWVKTGDALLMDRFSTEHDSVSGRHKAISQILNTGSLAQTITSIAGNTKRWYNDAASQGLQLAVGCTWHPDGMGEGEWVSDYPSTNATASLVEFNDRGMSISIKDRTLLPASWWFDDWTCSIAFSMDMAGKSVLTVGSVSTQSIYATSVAASIGFEHQLAFPSPLVPALDSYQPGNALYIGTKNAQTGSIHIGDYVTNVSNVFIGTQQPHSSVTINSGTFGDPGSIDLAGQVRISGTGGLNSIKIGGIAQPMMIGNDSANITISQASRTTTVQGTLNANATLQSKGYPINTRIRGGTLITRFKSANNASSYLAMTPFEFWNNGVRYYSDWGLNVLIDPNSYGLELLPADTGPEWVAVYLDSSSFTGPYVTSLPYTSLLYQSYWQRAMGYAEELYGEGGMSIAGDDTLVLDIQLDESYDNLVGMRFSLIDYGSGGTLAERKNYIIVANTDFEVTLRNLDGSIPSFGPMTNIIWEIREYAPNLVKPNGQGRHPSLPNHIYLGSILLSKYVSSASVIRTRCLQSAEYDSDGWVTLLQNPRDESGIDPDLTLDPANPNPNGIVEASTGSLSVSSNLWKLSDYHKAYTCLPVAQVSPGTLGFSGQLDVSAAFVGNGQHQVTFNGGTNIITFLSTYGSYKAYVTNSGTTLFTHRVSPSEGFTPWVDGTLFFKATRSGAPGIAMEEGISVSLILRKYRDSWRRV